MITTRQGILGSNMSYANPIVCVCCPEQCKRYAYFSDCNPLNPSRPVWAVSMIPREKRISYLPSPQLDLFGGAL